MKLPERKNIRLQGYDYSRNGLYFITICVEDRRCMFGNIINNGMELNQTGIVADNNIIAIEQHIEDVKTVNHVVMPNHIHLILWIHHSVGSPYMVNENNDVSMDLLDRSKQVVPLAIQQYKASVSRQTKITDLWQSKYYDHIIRNYDEYMLVARYIYGNPHNWRNDKFYNDMDGYLRTN